MSKTKSVQYLYLILLSFMAFACSQSGIDTPSLVAKQDEQALRYLKEVEWPKAYAEQDTVLLDRILGEDFKLIDQGGNWYTKQDELDYISENVTRHDSFRYEIKRLDVYPNGTAVVAGTGHIVDDSIRSIYQSSNVLIKRNGQWKAILSHVSGIKSLDP